MAVEARGRASATGLTSAQAQSRLGEEGPNAVAAGPRRHVATRVLRQLADPLVLLLLAALAITVGIGDTADATIIALVIIVNTTIGVVQEVRADRAVAALDRLAAPSARVSRDGADVVIPAAEVVRGDLVRLQAGDIVPADLDLISTHQLLLDESALTGESLPVERAAGDEARAGAVTLAGRGSGFAVRTGASSGLGRIAHLVATTRPAVTPLQKRLAGLSRVIGAAVVLLSAAVFVVGLLFGRPAAGMALTAVSLVVAAIPESLPAVVTLSLALAARRMAQRKAIPRRLHAVETLGSVTVVATDKTGTVTEGRMSVRRVVAASGAEFAVSGYGYDPAGTVELGEHDTVPPAVLALARAGVLCSDATITPPGPDSAEWRAVGDPVEAALVTFAGRCGLSPGGERSAWRRIRERPFDQQTRRMTTVHRDADGRYLVVCKGAPETVLTGSTTVDVPAGVFETAHRLAADGLRVLAIAAAYASAEPPDGEPTGLRYAGLVAIGDPVRAEAADVAAAFATAGIRLVLITGDHPGTATAIGGQLGIWQDGDEVHHGDRGAPTAHQAGRVSVFARTQPEQKLDIVAALQAEGEVVAMTGDGVNDAPALRRADIGVAMGGGTEVARQAADLVLVDDNLVTVAAAVREGRRIYDNIRRFLHYGLAGGLAEIAVMLLGPFLGLTVPLLPGQILWINLLTHGVPGVALGAEPAEPGTMTRPPRSPQESVLGGGLGRAVLRTGLLLAAVALAAGLLSSRFGWPWQTMLFVVLGLAQLGVALAVRATRSPAEPRNPGLLAAVAVSAVLQVAPVYVVPLGSLLGVTALSPVQLVTGLALAVVPGATIMVTRALSSRRPAGVMSPRSPS